MGASGGCPACGSAGAFRYDPEAPGSKTVWLMEGWDYSHVDRRHVGRMLYCMGCGCWLGTAEEVLGIGRDGASRDGSAG